MAPPLTPIRSPLPPRSHRRKSNGSRGQTMIRKPPSASNVAASSSEKETPTVLLTETSPLPNYESGGGKTHASGVSGGGRSSSSSAMASRSIMTVQRRLAEAAESTSRPRPKELFGPSQQDNSTSSSPGSKAEQSLVSSRGNDVDGDDVSSRGNMGDNRDDDDEFSSDHVLDDDAKNQQAVSMIQNVLDSGIASICRLRKLFPSSFFQKMDFDGTTITQFNKEAIKRIATMDVDEDESDYSEDEEDERSMVKSFQARTQKSLSPLTEVTQKVHRCDDRKRRMAVEALLLLRWMQRDGVGEILKGGNLASVRFGVCVPSSDESSSEDNNDELLESYSFNISCNKPENPSKVEADGVRDAFQNLNGFQAGRSLSQSLVPRKTQSSYYTQASAFAHSQASRTTTHYDTQMSSSDYSQTQSFALSQKHHPSECSESHDPEASEKSLMASMSQSIRVSVKKNRGCKIPPSRYLTLRIDFTKVMEQHELPLALKWQEQCSASPLLTSPVPMSSGGATGIVRNDDAKGKFVVTPLGRIAESGYSGLCVDMTAKTREIRQEEDDERSIHFSQLSHSFVPLSSRSDKEEDVDFCSWKEDISIDEDGDDEKRQYLPFTQPPEGAVTKDDSNAETTSSPREAASRSSGEDDEDRNEQKDDHTPFTQPTEREQVANNQSYTETADSPQEANSDCAESQANDRDETEDKENVDIEIGSKAFALPYGLQGGERYVLCDVRDHRTTKSCLTGLEREEYKCAFKDCTELVAVGKKKQWIMRNKLVAFSSMAKNAEETLDRHLKQRKGSAATQGIFKAVGEELKVDPGFVKKMAKKRKAAARERKNKRLNH